MPDAIQKYNQHFPGPPLKNLSKKILVSLVFLASINDLTPPHLSGCIYIALLVDKRENQIRLFINNYMNVSTVIGKRLNCYQFTTTCFNLNLF